MIVGEEVVRQEACSAHTLSGNIFVGIPSTGKLNAKALTSKLHIYFNISIFFFNDSFTKDVDAFQALSAIAYHPAFLSTVKYNPEASMRYSQLQAEGLPI